MFPSSRSAPSHCVCAGLTRQIVLQRLCNALVPDFRLQLMTFLHNSHEFRRHGELRAYWGLHHEWGMVGVWESCFQGVEAPLVKRCRGEGGLSIGLYAQFCLGKWMIFKLAFGLKIYHKAKYG